MCPLQHAVCDHFHANSAPTSPCVPHGQQIRGYDLAATRQVSSTSILDDLEHCVTAMVWHRSPKMLKVELRFYAHQVAMDDLQSQQGVGH